MSKSLPNYGCQETCPEYSIGTGGYNGSGYREVQAMKVHHGCSAVFSLFFFFWAPLIQPIVHVWLALVVYCSILRLSYEKES